MTKVIEAPVKLRRHTSVTSKRVKTASGKVVTLRTINADSPTFASDLSFVFGKNVTKARRKLKK